MSAGCNRSGSDAGTKESEGVAATADRKLPYEPRDHHPRVELSNLQFSRGPNGHEEYRVNWRITKQDEGKWKVNWFLIVKQTNRAEYSIPISIDSRKTSGTIARKILPIYQAGEIPLESGCEMYLADSQSFPRYKLSNSLTSGDASVTPTQPAPPDITPPQPAPPDITPPQPTEPLPKFLLSAKSFKVDVDSVQEFSLSPDGSTVGLAGNGNFQVGGKAEFITEFYDLRRYKKVGVPIKAKTKAYGPGPISNGGETAVYRDIESKVIAHDIKTGRETGMVQLSRDGFYAFAPDGKLLVTADKTKLVFRPWPAGGSPLEVETETPVLAMSELFQNGTRVATVHHEPRGAAVRVWDVKTGRAVDELPLNQPKITGKSTSVSVRVAPDGKTMIVDAGNGGGQDIWDLSTKTKSKWTDPPKFVFFQPVSGGWVAYKIAQVKFGGSRLDSFQSIEIVDGHTGDKFITLRFPTEVKSLLHVYFGVAADSKRAVAACGDTRRIYIWDLPK